MTVGELQDYLRKNCHPEMGIDFVIGGAVGSKVFASQLCHASRLEIVEIGNTECQGECRLEVTIEPVKYKRGS